MKLRFSVLALAILCLVSVIIGISLYYDLLEESVLNDATRRISANDENVSHHIAAHLDANIKAVKALAGIEKIGAALTDDGKTVLSLVEAADQALYSAKKKGRNTTVFFSESENR